jgi:DUF1009 family protein
MVATLRAEGADRLVIAGGVKRPDLRRIRPDVGFFMSLPQIVSLLAGGDDSVLTRVVRFFEAKGFAVCGVHEVAPDLLAGAGRMGGVALGREDEADAELGFAVRQALGAVDAGQAVVVAQGAVLAIEGAEGTDAMLQRVAALPRRDGLPARRGVLGERPEAGPGAARRHAGDRAAHHRAGGGCQPGRRGGRGRRRAGPRPGGGRSRRRRRRLCRHGLEPPAARPQARAGAAVGRVIGRRRPSRRDAADIETGLAAVAALAPFATGAGVVVVRHYILAIEAAEGVTAMLERAAALRQWGLRWHKVGVLVRRSRGNEHGSERARRRFWPQAAAQELAGIAVTGPADALAPYEAAARLADNHGLFLVLCEV